MATKTKPGDAPETAQADADPAAEMPAAEARQEKEDASPQRVWHVSSKLASYHSARRHWTHDRAIVPVAELTDAQVEELRDDPYMLIDGPFEAAP